MELFDYDKLPKLDPGERVLTSREQRQLARDEAQLDGRPVDYGALAAEIARAIRKAFGDRNGLAALLAAVLLCASACTGAARGGVANNPFARAEPTYVPPPPAVVAYDGHVGHVSGWLTSNDQTQAFTNTVDIQINCDDPVAAEKARLQATADPRDIIVHTSAIGWGDEGYALRPDAARCWQIERDFIANHRARIVSVHTLDEPWDVAWSYQGDGVYHPNRYNPSVTTVCAMVHADFPDLWCSVNVGNLAPGLVIPDGVTLVWIESYDVDWLAKKRAVESVTSADIGLMPPGFITGVPSVLDPAKAAIVRAITEDAKTDPRVKAIVFFTWCCDDTETGNRDFYTVSGGRLPLTLEALKQLGRLVRGN